VVPNDCRGNFPCAPCGAALYFWSQIPRFTLPRNSAITRTEPRNPHRAFALNDSTPILVPAFDHQDELFSSAFSILHDAIADRAFPAASVAVTHRDHLVVLKSLGSFTYENPSVADDDLEGGASDLGVSPTTLFDLASVTKVVATTTVAMILYERGLLELDAPVIGTIPQFLADSCGELDPRRPNVTLRMLLTHSSGLPAYEKLFLKARTREELLRAAFTTPLSADPNTRAEYSDIGFIILGAALEGIAEESLDRFCQREIFGPLAMTSTTFNPPVQMREKIPPTADEGQEQFGGGAPARETPAAPESPGASPKSARSTFRAKTIQGEVQDENALILGGVAGHAGLFSTAEDLARFAQAMLHGGRPILRPETVALFTHRESAPEGTSRALGWDTPSSASQSGKYFSPASFGHLGYTGTSLWIDPERHLSISLLTNRTWPDCANQAIKQVRPRFHDAVIEALNRESDYDKLLPSLAPENDPKPERRKS
jgi:CubicO group peptidase (beta-lactamase class C family)